MTLVLALIGAIVGALVGGTIGFFGVILLGTLAGADDQQGALAMGAAMSGLPLGLAIGAVLGCVLVVRMRRNSGAAPVTARQGMAALGITVAVLVGLYGYFLWEPPKPSFARNAAIPVIEAEIRMPAEMADLEFLKGRRSMLRTFEDTYYDADTVLTPRQEGDWIILSTRQTLIYRHEDRAVHLWVRPERLLIFELGLSANPAATDGFSDWQPVDHVRPGFYEEDIPPEEANGVAIRHRVIRPGN